MQANEFTLGLDLGVTSIGWAIADLQAKQIVDAGVRIFKAPMDIAKYEAGEPGGSTGAARRKSRHQRRQIRRRQARHRDLYLALQAAGMLPFAGNKAQDRHKELTALDEMLMDKWRPIICSEAPEIEDPDQILLYYMRAKAVNEKLDLEDLGRALYHMGQRRGFKSNRREGRSKVALKNKEKEEEELENSVIKSSIKSREEELDAKGLTLGQLLAFVNPHKAAIRNRKRSDISPSWNSRKMYQQEFERIWQIQSIHHPDLLTSQFKFRLERLIFKQRDVSPGKPGKCELEREPPLPRAPRSSLLAQHFRLVQIVNNLKVEFAGGTQGDPESWRDKRGELISKLSTAIFQKVGKKRPQTCFGLPFSEVKQILGLPKRANLNLDDDDQDDYLHGNRTNAIMTRAFGLARWNGMEDRERRRIVRKWMTETSPEKLVRIAKTVWLLPDEAAEELASLEPEDGYASLSHQAMLKLLPHLELGLTYSEAVKEVYGNPFSGRQEHEFLPPVDQALPQIPNPVVKRTLSELRKVLNAIIRKHGRPHQIRIELARELKRNAEQRQKLHEGMKERTKDRDKAKKLLEEMGERPIDAAVEKVMLYQRCKLCVYCGKPLGGLTEIFSSTSGIEVEHVLPRRCNDDSFSNKVLAHKACNVRKGDQTPRQAWDPSLEWDNMLKLVQSLKDKSLFDRFLISTEDDLQGFTNRHLADTRYISKLATQYVELLYGGRDEAVPWEDRNRRCVFASSGSLTAKFRKRWGLQGILNSEAKQDQNGAKPRHDHRHHTIDAIVIALTTQSAINRAAFDAQQHDRSSGYRSPKYFSPPWPAHGEIEERIAIFRKEIKSLLDGIYASHRPEHKLSGELHQETNYQPWEQGKPLYSRCFIQDISAKDINSDDVIPDRVVREAIRAKFKEIGGNPKLFQRAENIPYIEGKNNKRVPIRKVRILVPKKPFAIGKGPKERYVLSGGIHHIALFVRLDDKGREKWESDVVQITEAVKRRLQGKPIVSERHSKYPNAKFLFHLQKSDTIEITQDGVRSIYLVKPFYETGQMFFVSVNDASKNREALSKKPNTLKDLVPQKVVIDLLGKPHYINIRL